MEISDYGNLLSFAGVIRKDSGGSPGFVADADASMVSSVTNSSIRVTVHITKTDSYKTTPRAEDVAILYCQMAAYLQVQAESVQNSFEYYIFTDQH